MSIFSNPSLSRSNVHERNTSNLKNKELTLDYFQKDGDLVEKNVEKNDFSHSFDNFLE